MNRSEIERKAKQHWEMAGLARKDGDMKDAENHTAMAKEYDKMLRRVWQ